MITKKESATFYRKEKLCLVLAAVGDCLCTRQVNEWHRTRDLKYGDFQHGSWVKLLGVPTTMPFDVLLDDGKDTNETQMSKGKTSM